MILDVLQEILEIKKDPQIIIEIDNFDTHSVILAVKPYAEPNKYWNAARKTKEGIKKIFHKNNIKLPM